MEKLPEYNQIDALLLKNGIFKEAAEAHGLLCGLLVCNPDCSVATWLMIASDNPDLWEKIDLEDRNELEHLREVTLSLLKDPNLDFDMLIPKEASLAECAQGLGLWCKGFVNGVEHHGNYLGELMGKAQDDVDEALSDLQSIAEVDYNVQDYKAQKKALDSVIDYVRIAVLLVQRELSGNFTSPRSNDGNIH